MALKKQAMETKEVHITEIQSGDTILHNGEIKTVSGNNIKHCNFMGKTLFGDSYRSGHKLVTKVTVIG